jgi:hypothetical protein
MTIKALIYGGIQIGSFGPPQAHYTWDGIHLQLTGSTLTKEGWKQAGISIDMSSADAMDLILVLLDSVQKHADYEARLIPNFSKRLAKKLARKTK